ncbi:MAG: hypothetical protein V7K35_21505 [Nostoc sp.]|uniref:hypothetical protein n=1 Tax=Nostoc sp. TaxID=1180 RepID=UPI002FF8C382
MVRISTKLNALKLTLFANAQTYSLPKCGDRTSTDFSINTKIVTYDDSISQGALFARYEINFTPGFTANLGLRQDFSVYLGFLVLNLLLY